MKKSCLYESFLVCAANINCKPAHLPLGGHRGMHTMEPLHVGILVRARIVWSRHTISSRTSQYDDIVARNLHDNIVAPRYRDRWINYIHHQTILPLQSHLHAFRLSHGRQAGVRYGVGQREGGHGREGVWASQLTRCSGGSPHHVYPGHQRTMWTPVQHGRRCLHAFNCVVGLNLSVPVRPVWPSQPARCFVLARSVSAR